VSPSTLYATAAILEGVAFINGSPQNTFVPGASRHTMQAYAFGRMCLRVVWLLHGRCTMQVSVQIQGTAGADYGVPQVHVLSCTAQHMLPLRVSNVSSAPPHSTCICLYDPLQA
jgi:hypothetical protein